MHLTKKGIYDWFCESTTTTMTHSMLAVERTSNRIRVEQGSVSTKLTKYQKRIGSIEGKEMVTTRDIRSSWPYRSCSHPTREDTPCRR